MSLWNNYGMNRRHFMQHMATAAATIPAMNFLSHVQANADVLKSSQKSCILMWMGGGPPTIDIWDLKPGSKNGGEFKPIDTAASGVQISEHMPETAKVFGDLSLVRSMSTREADHGRGRYYMQTSYVPNPTVVHPTFGSVVSYEIGRNRKALEIPAFVSVDGGAGQAGFLGMTHAPFVVDNTGRIRNEPSEESRQRLGARLTMLDEIEAGFMNSRRGELPKAHQDVYKNAVNLMTSRQMAAFDVAKSDPMLGLEAESDATRDAYGRNGFGQGLLMARRLVQVGVPFVEVNMGGWDLHAGVFDTLKNQRLPQLDKGISAITADLKALGMLDNTVLVWMGEFGRTPRLNGFQGRDHWTDAYSIVFAGAGVPGGVVIGKTDDDGGYVLDSPHTPEEYACTIYEKLGIDRTKPLYTSANRPVYFDHHADPIAGVM